jgi:hypothetical protein
MSIPGPAEEKFFEKKWLVEALSVVPAVAAAVVGAVLNLREDSKRSLGIVLLFAAGWLLLSSVVKVLHAYAQDRERKRIEDYEGLRAALRVLYSTLAAVAGTQEGDERLRITIHRVVHPKEKGRDAELLEQMLPYVGGSGSSPRRTFSIRSGIIGRAAREKAVFAASRQNDDYEAFIAELVREWAYTDKDARAVSAGRQSWMAVPILGAHGRTDAVVYLDSSDRDLFQGAVYDLAIAGCAGITTYAREAFR